MTSFRKTTAGPRIFDILTPQEQTDFITEFGHEPTIDALLIFVFELLLKERRERLVHG